MTDRPIIFSAPMIRALLDGRKTQTRRFMPGQKYLEGAYHPIVSGPCIYNYSGDEMISRTPYAPGDRLWVRENWRPDPNGLEGGGTTDVFYPADRTRAISLRPSAGWRLPKAADGGLVPSIHMPRWASRLTLTVEGVKVERLQEISEEDAIAEGIARENVIVDTKCYGGVHHEITADRYWSGAAGDPDEGYEDGCEAFAALWRSIHGPDAWDANPWVAAISFTVHKCNIDAMREVA